MRSSGLPGVGAVPWGTHLCHLYQPGEELMHVLVPYFAAGLAGNERCIWAVAGPQSVIAGREALGAAVPDLDARVRAGQIDILDAHSLHFTPGTLALRTDILDHWLSCEAQAISRGYAGLRISEDISWLAVESLAEFAAYEARVHEVTHDRKILALCSYSLESHRGGELVEILRNHEIAVVRSSDGRGADASPKVVVIATAADHVEAVEGGSAAVERERLRSQLEEASRALEAETSIRRQLEAERSQLHASEQQARAGAQLAMEHLAGLQRATSALSEAATHADIARVVVTELAAVMQADQAILAVPTAGGNELLLLDHAGLQAETVATLETFAVETQLPVAVAFRTGVPVWLSSQAEIRTAFPQVIEKSRTMAIASMPLALGGRRLGAVGLGFFEPRRFEAAERALLDDLAGQVALALERARLYEEAKGARDRLQLLADATSRISLAKLDLEQVLDSIAVEVTGDLADGCAISLRGVDGKTLAVNVVRHVDPVRAREVRGLFESAPIEIGHGLLGRVAATGEPVVLAPVPEGAFESTKPAYRAYLSRHLVACLIIVPLRSGGEILGTLAASRDHPCALFTADDERLLQELADRAAMAIENALLYERAQTERQRAEDANRAKDEFLAMLGHELRNPLSPILTALHLMQLHREEVFPRERAIITRQVNHMVRLVDDLLDVSRITRGAVQLTRAPIELGEVVAKAIETASPLLEERAHELRVSVPGTGLCVDADAHRLAQVIANLLTNAAKYTPPGGMITIQAGRRGAAIELMVRDTGMGIDAELLPRVFDVFAQGRQSIDRAQGGLGLGLAIVRTMVEMHGGSVRVHSEGVGKGAEFTIRLPAVGARDALVPAASAIWPGAPPRLRMAATPRRVLVVDDNHDAANALAQALRIAGHTTRVAHDGPTALVIAKELRPEIALLDIGLPVMDGYELGRHLYALLDDTRPKLVAVTGYGQESDRSRSRQAGFDEHLVKPVDFERLVSVIDRLS